MALIPLVVIAGPTATGKTRLAVEMALRFGGEVVSADSMQIYRGMDIGTAKPTEAEKRGVPHHMIDVADPWQAYSVADYVTQARAVIADIHARGRLPVVAGGTGLYISSLVDNIRFFEAEGDEALRARLRETARQQGGEALLGRLAAFDPETAAKLHPNNLGRIIRAIEVYETTGMTMAEMQRKSRELPPAYRCCMIGLNYPDRAALYDRINRRVDEMFEMGLEREACALLQKPGAAGATAMQAIGYKELAEYFVGLITLGEAAGRIKQGTRRYAKRQLTWFRRMEGIHWLDAGAEYENICSAAAELIDKTL